MDPHRWVIAHTRKYHGLGNRVRSVVGSRVLARAESREFAYVWPVGRLFGARFDELWDVHDRTVPPSVSRALALRYPFRDNLARSWVGEQTRQERVWQIRTPHALELPDGMPDWTDDLRRLRPAPAVEAMVRDFHSTRLAGRPYLGVMVRTHPHSHQETLSASPVEWYVDRLLSIQRDHPDLAFFVSADTPEGMDRLRAAVPGCVGLSDKGEYNSRRALQASVADLYLLAASAHIIGPHYSSFTELAQNIGGPQLRLETSRTTPDVALESGGLTVAMDPTRPHLRVPLALA